MKAKRLFLIPVVLACGTAHAQSSVTLYGIVDEGIDFTSNTGGHTAYQTVSGNLYGSRWGLRGSEDLGGGMSAVFRLENGFNMSTGALGQGGREFGRVASVGLASERYGTVTLGRQYDPSIDLWSVTTGAGGFFGDFATPVYDNNNADYNYRINNSIKYTSPVYRGVTFEALYGLSNEAGGFADNRVYSLGAQYKAGALLAAVVYLKANNAGTANGALATDTVFTGSSQQTIDAGFTYRFAKTLVGFAYSHVDVYNPTALSSFTSGQTQPTGGQWKSWKFDNFELNGRYYIKPNFWAGGGFVYTQAHVNSTVGNFLPRWYQGTVMVDYDLSARTSLYVQGAYQHLVSAHTGTDFDYALIQGSAGRSSSGNQGVVRVGVTHRF
ncbi:porin [Paraburkholderia tropica]|uniref:porin n=1 Tax=Paraburkholderia tropica TaxID=92647 RepID=UPI002AB6A8D3|nr:porin [Paraburkholderia tropica]